MDYHWYSHHNHHCCCCGYLFVFNAGECPHSCHKGCKIVQCRVRSDRGISEVKTHFLHAWPPSEDLFITVSIG